MVFRWAHGQLDMARALLTPPKNNGMGRCGRCCEPDLWHRLAVWTLPPGLANFASLGANLSFPSGKSRAQQTKGPAGFNCSIRRRPPRSSASAGGPSSRTSAVSAVAPSSCEPGTQIQERLGERLRTQYAKGAVHLRVQCEWSWRVFF